jgi:hypothetical protein
MTGFRLAPLYAPSRIVHNGENIPYAHSRILYTIKKAPILGAFSYTSESKSIASSSSIKRRERSINS